MNKVLAKTIATFWRRLAQVLVLSLATGVAGAQTLFPATPWSPDGALEASLLRMSSLIPLGLKDYQIQVVPVAAPVNTPRTVFIRLNKPPGCGYTYYRPTGLDLSTLDSGVVTVNRERTTVVMACPVPPPNPTLGAYIKFTVSKPGTARIVFDYPDVGLLEATMTTTPVPATAAARFDINGMWFDTATNGSGISFHQSEAANKTAFGTWFMFDRDGVSRWYSLQGANWTGDGNTLEGLFIESAGYGCSGVIACPNRSANALPTYNFKIRFQSASLAVAEVFERQGEVLFSSNLRRLEQ